MLQQAWSEVLHFLFPARCLGCDRVLAEPAPWCATCAPLVELLRLACPRCALPLGHPAAACGRCLVAPPPFASARSLALYGGPMTEALGRLKFGQRPDVAEPLGRLLATVPCPADAELVVPVPLARDRLAERGYNQAQLLARGLRARLPIVDAALRREHATARQARLPSRARRRNVHEVFVAAPQLVRARRVLLVDDVMTTGATAASATRALLAAGAARVDVLTAARAVP